MVFNKLLGKLFQMLSHKDGNIATMAALFLPVALALAAMAVDEGALFLKHRESQSVTDLAAIAAASDIQNARKAATVAMSDNGISATSLENLEYGHILSAHEASFSVETGSYKGLAEIPPEKRFIVDGLPRNAVRVTMSRRGTLYFANGLIDPPVIETTAIAHKGVHTAFSVGSRLVAVRKGVLNELLGQLLGSEIELSAMDYEALLDADFELFQTMDNLALQLDLSAGTYSEVLDGEIEFSRFLESMSEGVDGLKAKQAIRRLASISELQRQTVLLDRVFEMGSLSEIEIGNGSAVFSSKIGVLETLVASAALANGTRQVEMDFSFALPQLASVSARLAIGEPPQGKSWFAIGGMGEIVRTAQMRLFLEAKLDGGNLLSGSEIRLPVLLELAYAEARLVDHNCSSYNRNDASVSIAARPGIAEAWIADIDSGDMHNFAKSPRIKPANLLDFLFLNISGNAHLKMGNKRARFLRFSRSDIEDGKVKRVSTSNFTRSLFSSLIEDLHIQINKKRGSLWNDLAVKQALLVPLNTIGKPLDELLYEILSGLGIKVGEADVRVHGIKCSTAVLVQ